MKIVINRCFGGFGLSDKAIKRYAELSGMTLYESTDSYGYKSYHTLPDLSDASFFSYYDISRTSEALIHVIEELKEEANGPYSNLKIIEIPDDVDWNLEEYDGNEWIAEVHRTWR